jgi:hypothetical protein
LDAAAIFSPPFDLSISNGQCRSIPAADYSSVIKLPTAVSRVRLLSNADGGNAGALKVPLSKHKMP